MQLPDRKQGVIWGHRLLLDRDPADQAAVDKMAKLFSTPAELGALLTGSPEYQAKFNQVGPRNVARNFPVDLREGVIWAYRLIFQQEPNEEQIAAQLPRITNVRDLRGIFVFSREFELHGGYGHPELADYEVVSRFRPFCPNPPPPGNFRDFLGSTTRTSYLPGIYAHKSGHLEGGPYSTSGGIHGNKEWIATLRSVIEAKRQFVAVELGLGWAPWLVASAVAANRLGITDVRLIGVEASDEHIAFSRQHFVDNGLDPDAHTIIHAIVGAEDGIARFPKITNPAEHYGANAAFSADEETVDRSGFLGAYEDVRCVSLITLLEGIDVVDILHSDIQGAETAALTAAIDRLNQCLRRIVIGTHSRLIDGEMIELFSKHGWILEYELPCGIRQQQSGEVLTYVDGEQVWRNPRLG
jgi:FkbM family methyltransferase